MRYFGVLAVILSLAGAAPAADPPDLVRYQGVLRDSAGVPLEGGFDMVLRLWSAASGGDEILVDSHTGADAVAVTAGLFEVRLGAGTVTDGSGPGLYERLHDAFADHSEVWLAVQVGAETLSPRVRIVAVPYAVNATRLAGESPDRFLDTTAVTQAKPGKLVLGQASGTAGAYGLEAYGFNGGGYFEDTDASGLARIGDRFYGVRAWGESAGGYFQDTNGSGYGYVGAGDYGIRAYGATAGGRFEDSNGSGYALLGFGDRGVEARGNSRGGIFVDSDDDGYVILGVGDNGLEAHGNSAGGLLADADGTGFSYLGSGAYGIRAYGDETGGYFEDTQTGNHARVGFVHRGIEAVGTYHGGYFEDLDGSAYAHVGPGILAYGDEAGGSFENSSDGSSARIAQHGRGIEASGSTAGGYFSDRTQSGHAYLGYGGRGVAAYGGSAGGYFEDTDSGAEAWMTDDDIGAYAHAGTMGAQFEDADNSGYAFVGYGDRGIWGKGTSVGGTLSHPDDVTYWADVARIRDATTYKIRGTGTVSFAQNHPEETDRLIVYAAPEGDEVAVYTRGSARLAGGEARVRLGETFSQVANPDIGLTAHLTSRDEASPLAVAGLSTTELIVRGLPGSNAAFDYLVYGLRVGFEEHSPVDLKESEAFLPPREVAGEFYARYPELRDLNALERFERGAAALGEAGEPDLSRTEALIAAIDANRDEVLATSSKETRGRRERSGLSVSPSNDASEAGAGESAAGWTGAGGPASDGATWMPVDSRVEAGDVLALDPDRPGCLRRAASPADPTVIGIASGPARIAERGGLETPVAVSGIVRILADAAYGEIRPGDALVASPTPGHAMRASREIPGTVLGKAIDPLPSGTGAVRALLVMQ